MLTAVADAGGSDLHLCTGIVPVYRKDGKLYNLSQLLSVGICTDADMKDYLWQIGQLEMPDVGRGRDDIDASYTSIVLSRNGNYVRCRMNAFLDRNGCSISLRLIPEDERPATPALCAAARTEGARPRHRLRPDGQRQDHDARGDAGEHQRDTGQAHHHD